MTINGVVFDYPEPGDEDWGPEATDWAAAVTNGMLQKAGGLFQLLAEVDFGTAFGLKSLYVKSRTALPADAGQIRLAKTDVINWRNNADGGNLSLGISASDVLQFNGADIQGAITVSDTATIDLTFVANVLSADIKTDSITNAMINSAAAIAYSKLNLVGSIVNADINAAAGIVYSKLSLTGGIVNADVNASAAIVRSKLDFGAGLVNADIAAAAAIAYSKLALTGSITNSDLADVATATFKGRIAGGTGSPTDLSVTQATSMLNVMTGDSGSGGLKGLVPAQGVGDATKFLNGAGLWSNPAGAGDVVGPAGATDNAVAVYDGVTGKLIKNSTVTISSGALTAPGALRSNASLILEDPGAGTNTTTIQAGTVSSSYSLTLPAAVAAANNSVLVSSTAGALTYVVAASANTASTIVQRDGSGNFTAGTITAALTGVASGNTTYTPNNHGVVLSGSANTMTVLAPDASTVKALISGGASADPAWGTLAIGGGGTGQTTKAAAFDALSPLTTGGDLLYGGASGTGTRLANGTVGQLLQSAGTTVAPAWYTPAEVAQSRILMANPNSRGGSTSGETTVINFATTVSSTGSDITLTARTTTSGMKFTINTKGVYAIHAVMQTGSAGQTWGITHNSSGLSTDVQSLADVQAPCIAYTASGSSSVLLSTTLPCAAGDVIRIQGEGTNTPSGNSNTKLSITRVA